MRGHRSSFVSILALVAVLLAGCEREAPEPKLAPAQQLARGREIYGRMCAVCHGDNGEGYKADGAPRLAQPEFLASAGDDFLRRAIRNGRAGTTMSAWGSERGGPLSPADVDAVVRFMHVWKTDTPVAMDDSPPAGNAVIGGLVFKQHCEECHGERGVGGPNLHIGDPGFLLSASDGFLRLAIRNGRPGTPMAAFEHLGQEHIEALVALMRTWALPHIAGAGEAVTPQPVVRPPPLPLGPVPLNPNGEPPTDFKAHPEATSVDVVKAALDRGERFAILDARPPPAYTHEHIAGAVSVPFYDPTPYFDALPKDAWLVCYCSCPHAESGKLAQKLVEKGFTKVTVLDEGLGVWKDREYPTHKGETP